MELGQLGDHRYVTVVLSLGNRLTHWFSAFFSLSVTSLSYLFVNMLLAQISGFCVTSDNAFSTRSRLVLLKLTYFW